ncbi:hypothetical protein [Listeria booriae]|nr:hypothetical protein [Listeria booriae]
MEQVQNREEKSLINASISNFILSKRTFYNDYTKITIRNND